MIYVTSDTHFCHNKDFLYKSRGFDNVYDMNKAIIHNWNSIVQPDDEVYLLGDVMLNDNEEGLKCLHQLKGNINIVLGNHDTEARRILYLSSWNVNYVEMAYILKYKGYHFYLSHYPTMCSNYDVDKPLKARIINVCGHSHTTDPWKDIDIGIIYHAELDAHNMMPISLDSILEEVQSHPRFKV